MSTVNLGNQIISVKYNAPVDSNVVNARHHHTRQPGIYKGGLITNNNTTFSVSPLVAEIEDYGDGGSPQDAQVRVWMQNTVSNIAWSGSQFAVLRWVYTNDPTANYMQVLAVDTPTPQEVIIGQRSGTTSVEYARRMDAGQRGLFLKVIPVFPAPSATSVFVKSGVVWLGNDFKIIQDQTVTIPSSAGTSFIYVNSSTGEVSVASTIGTTQGHILLARVRRSGSPVDETMIDDLRCFLTPPVRPDGATLAYTSGGILEVPNNGINDAKIRLRNQTAIETDGWLRGRNAANSADINIIRVNSSNQVEVGTTLRIGPGTAQRILNVDTPVNNTDAANKEYVDERSNTYSLTYDPGAGKRPNAIPDHAAISNQLHTAFPNASLGSIAFVKTYILSGQNTRNGGVVGYYAELCVAYKKTGTSTWKEAATSSW